MDALSYWVPLPPLRSLASMSVDLEIADRDVALRKTGFLLVTVSMSANTKSLTLQLIADVLAEPPIWRGEVVGVAVTRVVAIGAIAPAGVALDGPTVTGGCCSPLSTLFPETFFMPALRGDALSFIGVGCAVNSLCACTRSCASAQTVLSPM